VIRLFVAVVFFVVKATTKNTKITKMDRRSISIFEAAGVRGRRAEKHSLRAARFN
jgi:hypothetical protein